MDPWSIVYFLGCTAGWGFSTFIMGFLGKETIAFETLLFYQGLGALFVGFSVVHKVEFGFSTNHLLAVLNGLSFSLADLSYYLLSRAGMSVSILGPMSSMYVVIPMILGVTLLKEPLTFKKVLGLVCAMAAIYFLSSAEHEHEPVATAHIEEQKDTNE